MDPERPKEDTEEVEVLREEWCMGGGLMCRPEGMGGLVCRPRDLVGLVCRPLRGGLSSLMPRGKGVGVGPELGGGMDDITSLFFGARHPFCPGFGGTYFVRFLRRSTASLLAGERGSLVLCSRHQLMWRSADLGPKCRSQCGQRT